VGTPSSPSTFVPIEGRPTEERPYRIKTLPYFAPSALSTCMALDLGHWPRLSHLAPLALRTEFQDSPHLPGTYINQK
jgi:hypothetical protein